MNSFSLPFHRLETYIRLLQCYAALSGASCTQLYLWKSQNDVQHRSIARCKQNDYFCEKRDIFLLFEQRGSALARQFLFYKGYIAHQPSHLIRSVGHHINCCFEVWLKTRLICFMCFRDQHFLSHIWQGAWALALCYIVGARDNMVV